VSSAEINFDSDVMPDLSQTFPENFAQIQTFSGRDIEENLSGHFFRR